MASEKQLMTVGKEHSARVIAYGLPISTKFAVEVCHFIRGKPLAQAQRSLHAVQNKSFVLPFFRYNTDLCHKASCRGPGRYPVSTVTAFLSLFNSLEKNAESKGLDVSRLHIVRAIANQGPAQRHASRFLGRQRKNTHVELLALEQEVTSRS